MNDTPPDVLELAAEREKEAKKRYSEPALLADELHKKIKLRRFAGPASLVGRLDPLRVAHLTDLHVGNPHRGRCRHATGGAGE